MRCKTCHQEKELEVCFKCHHEWVMKIISESTLSDIVKKLERDIEELKGDVKDLKKTIDVLVEHLRLKSLYKKKRPHGII